MVIPCRYFYTMIRCILIAFFICSTQWLVASPGRIEGRVLDENNVPLAGATVRMEGLTKGATADVNGKFVVSNLDAGTYALLVGFMGYEKKRIEQVIVKNGEVASLNITLNPAKKGLNNVVVNSTMKKESMNSLLVQQKNMAVVSDGISAEMIRRSPDRNSGDVLKRVSGISIQDGKFAVIRGLGDRYNLALMNGAILPGAEADRKSFSFDVFPSGLLSNLTVYKSAMPELPAEFAGGLIELNTLDLPSEPFLKMQLGSGGQSNTTFVNGYDGKDGSGDWLGIAGSSRSLPSDFPSTETFRKSSSVFTKQDRINASKTLNNSWGYQREMQKPNRSVQLSGGYTHDFKNKSSLGILAALAYNRTERFQEIERNEYEIDGRKTYHYTDSTYRDQVLSGALLNVGYKLNSKNKVSFRSVYTGLGDDQRVIRIGTQFLNEQMIQSSALMYNTNSLWVNQLTGEHSFSKYKVKVNWGLNYNTIRRQTPDLMRTYRVRNYTNPDDTVFRAYVPMQASPNYSGRFFSDLKEKIPQGRLDVSVPFKILKTTQHLKAGYFVQLKNRSFHSRELGYIIADISKYNAALETLPDNQIFAPENMSPAGYMIDDMTQGTNSYEASSKLHAAYLQLDQKFLKQFRMVWGLRYEQYQAHLESATTVPIIVDNQFRNLLPSFNFTWSVNKKINVRATASKTLSRPEFREFAPFPFYDFTSSSVLVGNTKLVQTEIQNYDARVEYFPGKGQVLSASLFYKNFKNPIESVLDAGSTSGSRSFTYSNAPGARNYGLELEARKSLAFLSANENSVWNDISLFGNLALIHSKMSITIPTTHGDSTYSRVLQGQSPYVLNLGASANLSQWKTYITVLYNRIGDRLSVVGNSYIPNLYEKSRDVIDLQVAVNVTKRLECKLNLGDLLHQNTIFYQHGTGTSETTSYSEKTDQVLTRIKAGSTLGISVHYQFK